MPSGSAMSHSAKAPAAVEPSGACTRRYATGGLPTGTVWGTRSASPPLLCISRARSLSTFR